MKGLWQRTYGAFLNSSVHQRLLHPLLCLKAGVLSALIYTTISLVVTGAFLGVTVAGDYTWVARLGGAAWVFGLSMIVLMPIVTPTVKRWVAGTREGTQ